MPCHARCCCVPSRVLSRFGRGISTRSPQFGPVQGPPCRSYSVQLVPTQHAKAAIALKTDALSKYGSFSRSTADRLHRDGADSFPRMQSSALCSGVIESDIAMAQPAPLTSKPDTMAEFCKAFTSLEGYQKLRLINKEPSSIAQVDYSVRSQTTAWLLLGI